MKACRLWQQDIGAVYVIEVHGARFQVRLCSLCTHVNERGRDLGEGTLGAEQKSSDVR